MDRTNNRRMSPEETRAYIQNDNILDLDEYRAQHPLEFLDDDLENSLSDPAIQDTDIRTILNNRLGHFFDESDIIHSTSRVNAGPSISQSAGTPPELSLFLLISFCFVNITTQIPVSKFACPTPSQSTGTSPGLIVGTSPGLIASSSCSITASQFAGSALSQDAGASPGLIVGTSPGLIASSSCSITASQFAGSTLSQDTGTSWGLIVGTSPGQIASFSCSQFAGPTVSQNAGTSSGQIASSSCLIDDPRSVKKRRFMDEGAGSSSGSQFYIPKNASSDEKRGFFYLPRDNLFLSSERSAALYTLVFTYPTMAFAPSELRSQVRKYLNLRYLSVPGALIQRSDGNFIAPFLKCPQNQITSRLHDYLLDKCVLCNHVWSESLYHILHNDNFPHGSGRAQCRYCHHRPIREEHYIFVHARFVPDVQDLLLGRNLLYGIVMPAAYIMPLPGHLAMVPF